MTPMPSPGNTARVDGVWRPERWLGDRWVCVRYTRFNDKKVSRDVHYEHGGSVLFHATEAEAQATCTRLNPAPHPWTR